VKFDRRQFSIGRVKFWVDANEAIPEGEIWSWGNMWVCHPKDAAFRGEIDKSRKLKQIGPGTWFELAGRFADKEGVERWVKAFGML